MQSSGQALVLQVRDSPRLRHGLPPKATGWEIERLLDWLPEPHVKEQLVHWDHSVTSQSMAHAKVLQTESSTDVGHEAPP